VTPREAEEPDPAYRATHLGPRPVLVVVTGIQGTGKSTVAAAAGEELHAAVLGHDWAMSGLRPYEAVEKSLDAMGPGARRAVGWSLLCALARSQLRHRRSVVLDGVAGEVELANCRHVAQDEGASMGLVVTRCSDLALLRSRIDRRQRSIPNWYELTWAHVEQTVATWEEPADADLVLETTRSWEHTEVNVRELVSRLRSNG
jgi:predicted kinase